MNYNYLTIIATLFENLTLFTLSCMILRPHKKIWIRPFSLISTTASVFLTLIVQLNNNSWILLSLFVILLIYSINLKIMTLQNMDNIFFALIFAYMILIISQLPFMFLSMLYKEGELLAKSNIFRFLGISSANCIAFLIMKHIPVNHVITLSKKIPTIKILFTLSLIMIITAFYRFWTSYYHVSPAIPYIFAICLILCGCVTAIFYLSKYIRQESALQYYTQCLPLLNHLIDKTRANSHSYNNLVQSLLHLKELNLSQEQLTHYLDSYASTTYTESIPSSFLALENKLLTSLLYMKYCQAQEHHIQFEAIIQNISCESSANEFELVNAAGILLDNALENSSPNDTIYVTLRQETSGSPRFHMIVENPGPIVTEELIHNLFSRGYTTKEKEPDSHGIGLYSLRQMANKHHGSIIVKNTYKPTGQRNKSGNNQEDACYICIEIIL